MLQASSRLLSLSSVDLAIIVLYFIAVLGIGFYLKSYTKTGEDFFLAGREMTAWIAGLSFLAANLGSLELMGWAGAAYQYGILAAHWYWVGAIPAMLLLATVMIPFYYISKTHSVPGYLQLRFGEPARALSAFSFGFMTVLMSGINMYAMAVVLKVVLGWDISVSIWVSSVTVALQRGSAVRPDLAGRAAGFHNRFGRGGRLERHGGAHPRQLPGPELHSPLGPPRFVHHEPHGHPLGGHRVRVGCVHFHGLLDHGLPGRAARHLREGSPLSEAGSHHRRRLQDVRALHRDPARSAGPGRTAEGFPGG
jgi:hypothetical protein